MRKFKKIYQYEPTLMEIPDTGPDTTIPDMSLSVQEIVERWVNNQPLDVFQRNGDYLLEGDAEQFDVEDIDTMEDILDQADYMERKELEWNRPQQQAPSERASEGGTGAISDETDRTSDE